MSILKQIKSKKSKTELLNTVRSISVKASNAISETSKHLNNSLDDLKNNIETNMLENLKKDIYTRVIKNVESIIVSNAIQNVSEIRVYLTKPDKNNALESDIDVDSVLEAITKDYYDIFNNKETKSLIFNVLKHHFNKYENDVKVETLTENSFKIIVVEEADEKEPVIE